VLFANCWQVAVSIIYVQYNALLTAFLVGDEWSRFACVRLGGQDLPTKASYTRVWSRYFPSWCLRATTRLGVWFADDPNARVRKTLRVSAPEGIQRSSYFVSMPWRYGLPLIISMSVLHWLISQSVFVVAAELYDDTGRLDPTDGLVATSGYSIQGIISCQLTLLLLYYLSANVQQAVCLGFVFTVALILLGLRRYPASIPLASTCSAAISAACHPPPGDEDAYLFPLQWGVVSVHDGIGHCSLTTARDISPPQIGQLYA
jgi:hypothetical protein